MTRPLISTEKPTVAVRDLLRAALATQPEQWARRATVSTKAVPTDETPRAWPYVRVTSDGGARTSSLNLSDAIRVQVWHPDEGVVLDLALRIEALAAAGLSSPDVRSLRPRTRPTDEPDPDTGEPLAVVGLTAAMKPR